MGVLASATACHMDSSLAGPVDLSNRAWMLRVNYPAIQLSLAQGYKTVQLEVVTYRPDYSPWFPPGDDVRVTTEWESADSTTVHTTKDGFLTALRTTTTSGVMIFVRRQIDGVTLSDTARVYVSNLTDPPVLDTLRLRPTDSLKRAGIVGIPIALPLVLKDTGNKPVTGIPVAYRSLKPELANYISKWTNSLTLLFGQRGTTTIVASTYAYGVARADTFDLEIGAPLGYFAGFPSIMQRLAVNNQLEIAVLANQHVLGPGGTLQWQNNSAVRPSKYLGELLPGADIDVIFDDTAGVEAAAINSGSGHILGIPSDPTLTVAQRQRHRRFTKPGTYGYTIRPYGFRGTVIVSER